MMAVPGALIGIIWMLVLTGTTINVESLMGTIMTVGISVSNSILVVSFANDVRSRHGVNPFEAVIAAGRTRLRPIMMTALAMILGMIPMALGLGEAGEQNAPLGRAVIGGLLAATIATLIIVPRFSATTFWRTAADSGATQVNVIMAVSTILARRSRDEFVPTHKLRVVNGAPFTQEAMDVFKNEFKVPTVIEGFGMTEIPGAFSNPFKGPHKVACMGKLGVHADPKVTWTQVRILDDDGNDVPEGETGELAVKIPTLMQGYYKDPEQTADAFRDGWFLSGDLIKRDADGYYWFVARKKDIIRRRGENVAGAEIDRIDTELVELIAERFGYVDRAWQLKRLAGTEGAVVSAKVVTETGALTADQLPAASRARTVSA
jgi:acyl-CoA synthetase (AMP-forming)/AMP-acid ligase II